MINLGSLISYSNTFPIDNNTIVFNHNGFHIIFRYDDSLLGNYSNDISLCQQVIYYVKSDNIAEEPDWVFSFNENILGNDDYNGLVCRKLGQSVLLGMTGNNIGNCCYLDVPITDRETLLKISEFYTRILDYLIEKRNNSLSYRIGRLLKEKI